MRRSISALSIGSPRFSASKRLTQRLASLLERAGGALGRTFLQVQGQLPHA